MTTILLIAFYLFSPAAIIFISHKYKFLNKLGSVAVAYIVGIVAGASGLIPSDSQNVQEVITMVTIPLAIPLLLFSANIKQWFRLAGKTALSMLAGLISLLIMVIAGFYIFKGENETELWKTGGMLIGVYTGGTPNLASLKIMLDVDEEVYLLTHAYDMVLSGLYFLFLISFGQRFFLLFLSSFRFSSNAFISNNPNLANKNPYTGIFRKNIIVPLAASLGLSMFIFAISGGLSLLVPQNSQMVTVMLAITTFGIAASLFPKVNRIQKTFDLGMYLILIFSVVVASMVNLGELAAKTPVLLYYLALVIFGSLALHVIIAKIFRIDADTVIVTSTALICSPPFVPVVAGAIKNREIVVSGLTVGIVGYAIGNYLGFSVAQLLRMLT